MLLPVPFWKLLKYVGFLKLFNKIMDLYYSVLENGCQMFAFKGMNIGKPESTGVSTRTGWVVLTLGVLWDIWNYWNLYSRIICDSHRVFSLPKDFRSYWILWCLLRYAHKPSYKLSDDLVLYDSYSLHV